MTTLSKREQEISKFVAKISMQLMADKIVGLARGLAEEIDDELSGKEALLTFADSIEQTNIAVFMDKQKN